MGTTAKMKTKKKSKARKRLTTTTQDYLVKTTQGLRIDISNMAHELGESNQLSRDMGYSVPEEDIARLKELRGIERRINRLEDRLRTTTIVLKATTWGKEEVGTLMRPEAVPKIAIPRGRKVPRGLTAGEKYHMQ